MTDILPKSLLDAAIQRMPAGVIIAEAPSGKIVASNEYVERIWRHPAPHSADISEYREYRGFHEDGTPYEPEEWPLARSLRTGEVVEREEVHLLRGDGTFGVARVSSAPIRDEGGNIVAGVVTFIDVTAERREQDALALLSDASAIASGSLDPGETLRRIAGIAIPKFADLVFVHTLSDGVLQRYEAAAADPEKKKKVDEMTQRFPPSTEPLRGVFESGTSQLVAHVPPDAYDAFPDPDHRNGVRELGIRSVILVALRAGGRSIGVMTFASTRDTHPYDRYDVLIAEELGRRAAAAIEKAEWFEAEREQRIRAERSAERIGQLQALTSALATALTTGAVVETLIGVLGGVVQARAVVLAERAEDDPMVRVVRAVGVPEDVLDTYREFPVDSPLPLARAIHTGQPIWMPNSSARSAVAPILSSIATTNHAWAALPLESRGRAIGAIGFSFAEERPFDAEDRNFLMSIAGQCAIALERARLFETEQAAREEAERASRAKDEFLAILSHELRTPMTTVIGWADYLNMTRADDPELAGPIEALRKSAKVQAKLVDDLLDVSRIIAGKLAIRSIDTELTSIVQGAVDDLRLSATSKGVELVASLADGPVRLQGDPDRLRQIVTNLIVNAIKFTPSGGRVTVSVIDRGNDVELIVEDTGEGIEPAFLPHVFDRFRQASVGDSRRYAGLGLGLSIVQHLVQRHGGSVRAESDGLGHGATFSVCLPKRHD